jgi:hypothetical protein
MGLHSNITSSIVFFFLLLDYTIKSTCDKHFCSSLNNNNNKCLSANPIIIGASLAYYNVTVALCDPDTYCPIGDYSSLQRSWNNTTPTPLACVNISANNLVDGESCTDHIQCKSTSCDKGKCRGYDTGHSCTTSSECTTKAYCKTSSKTCENQVGNGEACDYDDACPNKSGCYNNICTTFFSLPPKTPIASQILAELYCNTSFYYNGVCASIQNVGDIPYECNSTNPCTYNVLETNTIIPLPNLCVCGYNSQGKSYCQLGSTSNTYLRYRDFKLSQLDKGCQVGKRETCSNQISPSDIKTMNSLLLSWKGYFQLSDTCLVEFYSEAGYNFSVNIITYAFIFLFLFF